MKITKRQLKRIIRETRSLALKEAIYSGEYDETDAMADSDYQRTEVYLDWMHKQLAPKASDILAMLLDRKSAPYNSEEMAGIINDGTWYDAVTIGESLLEAFKIDFEEQEKIYTGDKY